jgi:hypothetical protein
MSFFLAGGENCLDGCLGFEPRVGSRWLKATVNEGEGKIRLIPPPLYLGIKLTTDENQQNRVTVAQKLQAHLVMSIWLLLYG